MTVSVVLTTVMILFCNGCSAFYNLGVLVSDYVEFKSTEKHIKSAETNADWLFHDGIEDCITKPEYLPDNPNVVLIFTEGLSRNIIHDSRDIMPNVKKLESESLHFENYYNHTFATYRGLIGQLYSGYQLNNYDSNSLMSLQSILKVRGYNTAFINTEPNNKDFTGYLSRLNFDKLLTDASVDERGDSYIYDKDAYALLFETITEQSKEGKPFFTAIYTFGTHVSLDSPDVVYGDGKDPLLNKFFNADYWLGDFLLKFKSSPLYDNTILVFTADHATYQDDDFRHAFPTYLRESDVCDEIPLIIYFKGETAVTVDVNGRNSLDLAPTVLDLLDISSPNYFVGTSLLGNGDASQDIPIDTVFYYLSEKLTSHESAVRSMGIEESETFLTTLIPYLSISRHYTDNNVKSENGFFETEYDPKNNTVLVKFTSDSSYERIWFAFWNDKNGQDDLVWYEAKQIKNNQWERLVDMCDHEDNGIVLIHVYTGSAEPKDYLIGGSVMVGLMR